MPASIEFDYVSIYALPVPVGAGKGNNRVIATLDRDG